MSSVFSSQDQFCPFCDQFCRFAYIIRPGDHFFLRITFAVVQSRVQILVRPTVTSSILLLVNFVTSRKRLAYDLRLNNYVVPL